MSLKFADAFTFVFKEKVFIEKLFIGFILLFFVKMISISMDVLTSDAFPRINDLFFGNTTHGLIVLIFLYFLSIMLIIMSVWACATVFGYIITSIRRYMRAEEDILPCWADLGKFFNRGLKAFLAVFVYSLALFIFAKGVQIFALLMLPNSLFFALLAGIVALFVVAYAVFVMPALLLSFCEKDRFIAAFDVVRARQLLLKSAGKYFLAEVMILAVCAIMAILTLLLFNLNVGFVVLPLVAFYLSLVKGNILAQYYTNYCKEN